MKTQTPVFFILPGLFGGKYNVLKMCPDYQDDSSKNKHTEKKKKKHE